MTPSQHPESSQPASKSPAARKRKPVETQAKRGLSLGFIETRGLIAAIDAADAMLKAAYVDLVGIEKIGSGLVTVVIEGDVASVKAATESGSLAASRLGELVAVHVIARPDEGLPTILPEQRG